MSKRIHVAVGIVINPQKKILLAKRHDHLHQGGKWEFPGGKVETNESVTDALIRELKEEVNLDVNSTSAFMDISHDYLDKHVRLDIHLVTDFSGNVSGMEGQQVKWVTVQSLNEYEFPEANKPILEKLFNLDI
ncbi:7,8-dihydro-8-oxoguanine-triphosphatase [Shewanella algicola]|uniref:8-oxo-dGTP diphosphatase n=1 Tax=Shewanella algicola TaxID=640633 RepID=A0A9X1ZBA5_9GAMM|nr:8-oxo-dGTP diphosphatase MutT [Shewanella algicola]MCL1107162.1 8-oxo-dGTP diphosphatase MutT [Shewanella algicola]GGP65861.1 7,8-dihydro-8-oxoguanine-triphosphatase [Shewanella algicola]